MLYVRWSPPLAPVVKQGRVSRGVGMMLGRLFGRLLPRANPDFGHRLAEVKEWWFEVDSRPAAVREIGFDARGEPITCAPIGRNFGFFTEYESLDTKHLAGGAVSASSFEEQWQIVSRRLKDGGRG